MEDPRKPSAQKSHKVPGCSNNGWGVRGGAQAWPVSGAGLFSQPAQSPAPAPAFSPRFQDAWLRDVLDRLSLTSH